MREGKHIVSAALLLFTGIVIYFALSSIIPKKQPHPQLPTPTLSLEEATASRIYDLPGRQSFEQNCGACHGKLTSSNDGRMTFAGLLTQWPEQEELIAFIRDPKKVMMRNAYAKNLVTKFGVMMPSFPDLSDQEITAILTYIKAELNN